MSTDVPCEEVRRSTSFVAAVAVAGAVSAGAVDWNGRLAFYERYDDNITQLSRRDLDRLASSGGGSGFGCGSLSTDTSGGRFTITTQDDFVSIPQVSGALKADLLAGRPTAFGAEATVYKYGRNEIKTYESYRLWATQPLQTASAHGTTLGLFYETLPSYYFRNLRSDRTAENLANIGVFALPPPRREATYRRGFALFRVEQVLLARRLRFIGSVGREDRNYNPCFDERDSRMPFHEFELVWGAVADERLTLRASYRREDLHAQGDLPDTPDFVEEDVSSRRDIWTAEVRGRWGRRGRRTTLRAHYEVEKRDYLTGNPNDIFHFGRLDRRRYVTLAARRDLGKRWFVSAEAERDIVRSRFPGNPGSTFAPEDATDYTENLVQIGMGCDFGFGPAGATGRLPGPPRE